MVVKRQCSFCAAEIEPGTGSMFVKRDGTVFHFCSSSCRKQQLHLGRVGHRFKWTRAHALKVSADRATPAKAATPPAKTAAAGKRAPRAAAPAESAAPEPAPGTSTTAPAADAREDAPAATPAPPAPAPKAETAAPAKKPRARKKPKATPAETPPSE